MSDTLYRPLVITRNAETGELEAVITPLKRDGNPYSFFSIGYGFQLLDEEPKLLSSCDGFHATGETAITVLWSSGQHLKTEIMVVLMGIDGEARVINKGSIPFKGDEDLRWVERIVNGLLTEWADNHRKVTAIVAQKPAERSKLPPEVLERVKTDPIGVVEDLLAALRQNQ